MQDEHKKTNKMSWDRGYYIALILCVAAIGISGYLFTRTVTDETAMLAEPSASSAPTATVSAKPEKPSSARDHALPAAVSDLPPETQPPETGAPEQTLATVSPVDGALQQDYSMERLAYNPTTRDWRTHDGVDYAAASGATVVAAADGVVESVYEDDFFGMTVTVSHTGGYVSSYANLDANVPVQAGQHVKAGDALGTVGHSALLEISSAPHLHFSVTKNGVSVDPSVFLEQ